MRVLSWNLFHGRALPPAGRPLLHEFAAALDGWAWDVALLQEVPPWWPPLLARACDAEARSVLTSRNALLPLRRAVASRRPDLLRSNGGGANAILVRGGLRVSAHGRLRLRTWPERRVVHAVRVGGPAGDPLDGAWLGNVHAQKGEWDDGPGLLLPRADLTRSVARLEAWAQAAGGGAEAPANDDPHGRTASGVPGHERDPAPSSPGPPPPLLLGGDLNLPRDAVEDALVAPWARIASSGPDHVVGRGAIASGASSRPDRGPLSDHAPLSVAVGAVTTP